MNGFSLLEVMIALTLSMMVVAFVTAPAMLIPLRTLALSLQTAQAQGLAARGILEAAAHPCEWVDREVVEQVTDEGRLFDRRVVTTAFPGNWLWEFDARVSWRSFNRRNEVRLVSHVGMTLTCPQWLAPYP
jgi:Tfp pilus assembly protein PilV